MPRSETLTITVSLTDYKVDLPQPCHPSGCFANTFTSFCKYEDHRLGTQDVVPECLGNHSCNSASFQLSFYSCDDTKGWTSFFWVTRCDKTIRENGSFLLALQPLLIPFTSKSLPRKSGNLLIFFPKFGSKANSSAKLIVVTMCNACWPCQHPLAATEPCAQQTRAVAMQPVRDAGCSGRSVESFVKLGRASTASTMWTP